MRLVRFVPDATRIDFMRWRFVAFAFTILLTVASIGSLAVQGLNLGIDFQGGILVEVRTPTPPDVARLRTALGSLGLGEISIQGLGHSNELLIRVPAQAGGSPAQIQAIEKIKAALGAGADVRRTEFIGPQVSRELLIKGVVAAILAVVSIAVYVWFRFEWQFGLSALITTFHDVIATFGLFSLFHLEFNLTIVAAVLTIAGYSINDTVVVFDRVRESMRRYKTVPMAELINLSINSTLSRTVLTAGTTLVAALSLLVFGGPVLFGFSAAMVFGILLGTYSSIFVAATLLLHMRPIRAGHDAQAAADEALAN